MEDVASSPFVLVAAADLRRVRESLPDGLPAYAVLAVSEHEVAITDVAGRDLRLMTAPMLCLGLLATRQADLDLLDRARALFERWSAHDFPPPVLVPERALADRVGLLLATALLERLRSYAAHTTRLSRELARLRTAHETLHNAFAAVEAFLGASNTQPCLLAYENAPAGLLDPACYPDGLSQVLPVSSTGLSAVQLHVGPGAGGGLVAELRTLEDRAVHGTWRLGAGELDPGWVTLSLPAALAGLQRTPQIVLRPRGAAGTLPSLSAGPPQPLPNYRPRPLGGGAGAGPASLALRAWIGLPGVRPPPLGRLAGSQVRRGDGLVHEVALPASVLAGVARATSGEAGEWRPDFAPVQPLPELRGLLCHPPPAGLTLGCLPGLDAPEPSRFAARAAVRSPDSAPVEFALAFTDAGAEAVIARLAGAENGVACTGWRRVAPVEPVPLQLDAPPLARDGALFFATRMADGAPNDFAWASLLDLRRTLLGRVDAALPDAPYPPSGSAAGRTGWVELPEGLLSGVGQCGAVGSWDIAAAPVAYDADRRAVLCHPPPSGVTIARIAGVVERGSFRLRARLDLANDKAAPVAFQLAVSDLPPEAVAPLLGTDGTDPRLAGSGWREAAYGDAPWVEVVVPAMAREVSVYLATRMARPDGSNDYAWAFFAGLQLETLPDAAA